MYSCISLACTEGTLSLCLSLSVSLSLSQAFVNLTSNIREALFKVLLLTLYTDEGNVVLDNGDEVGQSDHCCHGNNPCILHVHVHKLEVVRM